ncbi:Surfeit locus protein 6 [Rhynchospora pubera]|uniref:Surfeit locus protein 6 n=1 Tax=Rhynchospora pubera TaxID=906938 RepID=A0AAV8DB10_9POAL|nr:Surfeit locus protein 6 [Rhynchospora pubera]
MGKKRAVGADEPTTTSPLDLKTLIREHSLFFDQLVELIPARFFLPNSSSDKPWFPGLSKSQKKKVKTQTRENILKSRRDRLDPTRPTSTLDLLKKSLDEERDSSSDEEDDEDEAVEEEEEEEEKEVVKAQSMALSTDERPVTYEELRERLRRRIEELSAGRNTRPESKLKQERKKEMKNKKKVKVQTKRNQENNKEKEDASAGNTGKRKRDDGNDANISKNNKKKNKVEEPTDITYGQVRIDGKENKKRKKKLSKEKELERAKRLEEVKKDPEKGKKVSWKAAVSKAAGEKVHDDPKLLKQSIKREKKRQEKNKQKWRERKETVAKAKAEKQSKRSENIKERIHQKKMRKIEKREKKLMRPGFEGRNEA